MAQNDAVDIAFSTFYTMKSIEVVAGVITDGGRIFATQRGYGDQKDGWEFTQRGYGDQKDGWEFPGGKMEPGETPEQALVRELQEELDVKVNVGEKICTVEYDYPKFHLTMHCFYCTLAAGCKPKLLEHEDAKWLDREPRKPKHRQLAPRRCGSCETSIASPSS